MMVNWLSPGPPLLKPSFIYRESQRSNCTSLVHSLSIFFRALNCTRLVGSALSWWPSLGQTLDQPSIEKPDVPRCSSVLAFFNYLFIRTVLSLSNSSSHFLDLPSYSYSSQGALSQNFPQRLLPCLELRLSNETVFCTSLFHHDVMESL